MTRTLVAAVVTLAAAQAVAWGRLAVVDRQNARLRASLDSAERRAAEFTPAKGAAVRPAVATRVEREPVAGEVAPERPIEVPAIEPQIEVHSGPSGLEGLLGLDEGQQAWLETLRRQWTVIAAPYWAQSRPLTPDELDYLKTMARRFDEAFHASLRSDQLRRLRGMWPPLLWSLDRC